MAVEAVYAPPARTGTSWQVGEGSTSLGVYGAPEFVRLRTEVSRLVRGRTEPAGTEPAGTEPADVDSTSSG